MTKYKTAYVDYWALTKNFKIGDTVTLWGFKDSRTLNVPGTVTAVLPGIGFVDVEFPWGNQRISSEELILVNDDFPYCPPRVDTGYKSWDKDMSINNIPKTASTIDKLAADYDVVATQVLKMACQCKLQDLEEVDTYTVISATSKHLPDHLIRNAVSKIYAKKEPFEEDKKTSKTAIYWNAPGRKYKMNKGEIDDGLPNCPKCESNLQKTNYKKHTKLFVCPECLFCIKPSDIEGLPEYVEETGFGVGPGEEEDLLTAALVDFNGYHEVVGSNLKKSFSDVISSESPSIIDIRNILGVDGLKQIYTEVKRGTTSPVIVEQFIYDFEQQGFSNALFFLSNLTADGLFDRDTYNRLVDTLDNIKSRM